LPEQLTQQGRYWWLPEKMGEQIIHQSVAFAHLSKSVMGRKAQFLQSTMVLSI